MVTKSGIVLDYDSNLGISGALVHVYTVTGTELIASGNCSPVGDFFIEVPDSVSGNLIYVPVQVGYRGYNRQISNNLSFLNLFLRKVSSKASSSNLNLSLYNTGNVTSVNIVDIAATATHYYIITDNGLDIVDANTLYNVGYVVRSGGYSCITLDRTVTVGSGIYLGTSNSGVYRIDLPASYSILDRDISDQLISRYSLSFGNILSNDAECLHINSRGELGVGTPSGIDFYTISGRKSHLYTSWTGTRDIFVSEFGDLYYSPTNSGLHVKYGPVTADWASPDYTVLISGTGDHPFPLLTNYINDIAVTSVSGSENNYVFLATPSGVMYYQENSDLNISASNAKTIKDLA